MAEAEFFKKKVLVNKEDSKEDDDEFREIFNSDEEVDIKSIRQLVTKMNKLSLERRHKLTEYKERIAMLMIRINGNREFKGLLNDVESSIQEPLMEDLPIAHKVKKLINITKETLLIMQTRYQYIMKVESEKGALYEKLLDFYKEKESEINKLYNEVESKKSVVESMEKEKFQEKVKPEMETNFMKEIGNALCIRYIKEFKRDPTDARLFNQYKLKFLDSVNTFFFTLDKKRKEMYGQELFFKGTRNEDGSIKTFDYFGEPILIEPGQDAFGNKLSKGE